VRNFGERAVVLRAGMAGLLAARVLSEFYGSVTLVEGDVFPHDAAQRSGAPQGRHLHGILTSGSRSLGRLLPGLLDELVSAGANVCHDGDLSRFCLHVGRHQLTDAGRLADPAASVVYIPSRPFLESHVSRRVRVIENVLVLDGHDAVGPLAEGRHRVTGARVANVALMFRRSWMPSWWLMRWAEDVWH
jgi:hypothetical protein